VVGRSGELRDRFSVAHPLPGARVAGPQRTCARDSRALWLRAILLNRHPPIHRHKSVTVFNFLSQPRADPYILDGTVLASVATKCALQRLHREFFRLK
jgi:hypothetical protein